MLISTEAMFLFTYFTYKVWHSGLLFKLKKLLPTHFYLILKTYLSDRYYYVKVNRAYSGIHHIQAGVPQGSVRGSTLYTIYTSDMKCG